MIRYSLRCAEGHAFEGWFRDAEGFERQRDAGLLACADCGSAAVDRALMAPPVRPSRGAEARVVEARGAEARGAPPREAEGRAAPAQAPRPPAAGAPPKGRLEVTPVEQALAALRRHVEAHSTDVGREFATQARAMHEGRAEPRGIHGEAAPEEARALVEDGVPILPLPFAPRAKAN